MSLPSSGETPRRSRVRAPTGARAARVRPRGRRQRTVLCHTSHARNAFHIVHHHLPSSKLVAFGPGFIYLRRDHLPTTYNVTVPADDPGGYEPGKRGNAARRRRTRPRTSGVSPLSGLCVASSFPVPRGCVDGCAGVRRGPAPGCPSVRGTRWGRSVSEPNPSDLSLVRLAAVACSKIIIYKS